MKKTVKKIILVALSSFCIVNTLPMNNIFAQNSSVSSTSSNTSSNTSDIDIKNNNFTDFSNVLIPKEAQFIGLGESSHGVSEYQNLKGDFFKHLVKNKITKTFTIEGDFGGALAIDDYINGIGYSDETSEKMIGKLGFNIYKTKEMAAILDWMKEYNKDKNKEDRVHIYGFDCQRADDSKDYIFKTLNNIAKDDMEVLKKELEGFNNNTFYDLKKDEVVKFNESVEKLIKLVESKKDLIIKENDDTKYLKTMQCAKNLKNQLELNKGDRNYGIIRDEKMAENAIFIKELVGEPIYLNAHNGHISYKSNLKYDTMGKILKDKFKEKYIAFGTDAKVTEFNSFENGKIDVVTVENENAFYHYNKENNLSINYFDLKNIKDEKMKTQVNNKMYLTTLNVSLSPTQRNIKYMFSINMVPSELYNGIFTYNKVNKSTLLLNDKN